MVMITLKKLETAGILKTVREGRGQRSQEGHAT